MPWDSYLYSALVLLGFATGLWVSSIPLKDVSIVDRYWGLLFVIAAAYILYDLELLPSRTILVFALVTIWGTRLSLYLTYRNWNAGEDYRYQAMRREQDQFWWKSLFRVFILQALLAWFISSTLWGAMLPDQNLCLVDWLALALWAVGFYFEAVGDWQLVRFKSDPANQGKLLTSGLWRLTRHPNYFGDAMCWWAYALFAIANGHWWGTGGAILMTYLLLKVSGVTMLEKTLIHSKEGYVEYVENTPAFFPSFRKMVRR